MQSLGDQKIQRGKWYFTHTVQNIRGTSESYSQNWMHDLFCIKRKLSYYLQIAERKNEHGRKNINK